MARMARLVVPGIPHHVVQRGNRNQKVFFSDSDKRSYLEILKEQLQKNNVHIWAYCLMDNHVHFIAVPEHETGLSKAFAQTHIKYTRLINFREKWRGYLWQGRFSSFPLDEKYLYAAVRYVERNPVEAKMVAKAEDYPWSSAKAHIFKTKDPLLKPSFLDNEIINWSEFLTKDEDRELDKVIQSHSRSGRLLGEEAFVAALEEKFGLILKKSKPGPKSRANSVCVPGIGYQ